ncbi:MAG: hypothetical protein ACR2KJ_06290 [Jatrophihabitans sp.]
MDHPVDGSGQFSTSSGAYSSRLMIDGEEFDVPSPADDQPGPQPA